MSIFWQGLTLSLAGMGLTFLALGLFILVMVVLQAVFRPRNQVPVQSEAQPAVSAATPEAEDEEVAAAIAVALAHLRSLEICRANLGEALEAGRGPWWTAGRATRAVRASLTDGRPNQR